MVDALDAAARQLRRSRADVIRLTVEHCLEDFDDLSAAVDRLRDPADPVLDWDEVRRVGYSIRIKESAAKELRRVAGPRRARIVAAIDRMAVAPISVPR